MSASIIVDTAQCFSTHQFACLIGYGARSILHHTSYFSKNPWVFFYFSLLLLYVKKHIIVIAIKVVYFYYVCSVETFSSS